jgi:hypothetical protein
MNSKKQTILDFLDHAFDKQSWHGTNLRGSLRGLKLKELLFRLGKNRHCIWEIALHCAYWKYIIYRKITNSKKGEFPRAPSNFPTIPRNPALKDWKKDLLLLEEMHKKLLGAVKKINIGKLSAKAPGSKWKYEELIYGVASHDLYHAGQIQLLKRLMKR